MKNFQLSSLALALTLTACGGSSSSNTPDPTPATLAMSGSGVKGALISAKVQVYRASDTGFATPLTTEPADVQTDENGDYTATVVDASGNAIVGALVVKITADDDTQMRCDAAVSCGDVLRGELIPNSEVAGISLSTLTVAEVDENGASVPVDADANTLTTMATDAVLAQVAANTAIDIDNLAPAGVEALQKNASVVVGDILGVDLSTTNIYDIEIVDSTDTDAVIAASTGSTSVTGQLTAINASLTAVTGDGTIAETINSYVADVAVVSGTVLEAVANGEDIATALASDEAVTAQVNVAAAQIEISDEATEIATTTAQEVTNSGSDVVIEAVTIPTTVEPITEVELEDVPLNTVTGATGGTGV